MRRRTRIVCLSGALVIGATLGNGMPAHGASDPGALERLESRVEAQQKQIDAQQETIENLKRQVGQSGSRPDAPRPPPAAQGVKPAKTVTTSNDQVSVTLYGQLDRAVLWADDGNEDNVFHVDNDNSSTRIGLLGSVQPIDDFSIGTRFEVEFQSNPSNKVSQTDQRNVGSNSFDERHFDVFVRSDRFGKLSIGQGDTASNGTSEVDLSGTAVVGYSDVVALAGGQFFFDRDTDDLSTTRVNNVFNNFDGLSRDDRIRYDTPTVYGFAISASAISQGGHDVVLRYSAKTNGVKVAGAAAWANPPNSSDDLDNQYNGSLSVLHASGINLTAAGGMRDVDSKGRDNTTFVYGKLGYQRVFCPIGKTAFSVDYARNDDLGQDGDKAESIGALFVQNIDRWATEYYLGYRNYQLDRDGVDFDDINAVLSGLRVKF